MISSFGGGFFGPFSKVGAFKGMKRRALGALEKRFPTRSSPGTLKPWNASQVSDGRPHPISGASVALRVHVPTWYICSYP